MSPPSFRAIADDNSKQAAKSRTTFVRLQWLCFCSSLFISVMTFDAFYRGYIFGGIILTVASAALIFQCHRAGGYAQEFWSRFMQLRQECLDLADQYEPTE